MSDIYCGINKTPKGQRLGTMKECAEKGQIRRFGINKIDKKTLELAKKKDVIPETREKLIMKMASLRGSIRKYKGRYETTKDKDAEGKKKKEDYRKLWVKAENDLKKVITKLQKVEKERDALKKKTKNNTNTKTNKKKVSRTKSKSKSKTKSRSKARTKTKPKTTIPRSRSKARSKSKSKSKSKSRAKSKSKTKSKSK